MYSEWVRRHRRNLGIPLIVAALLLSQFQRQHFWMSVLFVAAGEALRIWAAGHLRKEQMLTTGGPYRFIRNPLYLGSLFLCAGFCLVTGSLWIWLLVPAYFLLCYLPVIRYEESILRQKFSNDFPAYAAAVPAFYPTFKMHPGATTTFSWRQVIKNKEYNAVLGILLGYAYLFLR